MQFVVIHCGQVVLFTCKHKKCENSAVETTLSFDIYKLNSQEKFFKLCNSAQSNEKVKLNGLWKIVSCAAVDSDSTGILQPCLLVYSCLDGINNFDMMYELYQLKDMKSLTKILSFKDENNINDRIFFRTIHVYICDGPSIALVNFQKEKMSMCKSVKGLPILLSCFLKDIQSIFAFDSCFQDSKVKCYFLSQKVFTRKSKCNFSSYTNSSSLCAGWIYITILCDFTAQKMEISYKEFSIFPSLFCPIASKVFLGNLETESSMHFIITSRHQLIMIKNGKIFSVCDVPLTTCDSIYVIGDQDYQIAVILEKDKRKACAISTNTFEVIKTWNNVILYTCGKLINDGKFSNFMVLFQTNLEKTNIQKEEFIMFSNLKDVIKVPEKRLNYFKLESSSLLPDTECNLYSPPDCNLGNSENVLNKIINTLDLSVNKHKSAVNDLRQQLDHINSAIQSASVAICKMNNNLHLENNVLKYEDVDLIDLFSTNQIKADQDEIVSNNSFLKLEKSWQYVILDRWILGFDLANISERFLFRFGVVLSKPSSFDVAKRESSGHSRVFRRTVALNQDLSQIADGADSFRVNSSDHLNTSPRVGVVSPGESFTVTTCLDLHSFSNPLSSVDLFHAAIVTHAKAAPETGGGLGSSAPYVFQCGRVSLNASQIASNSLSINVERLLDTTTGSRADVRENIFAIKAYHLTEKTYSFSSSDADMFALCQDVLCSVGFKHHQLADLHLCTEIGAFYLTLVYIMPLSKVSCDVTISCKSDYEASLLLNYFKEQVCNDLKISTKD